MNFGALISSLLVSCLLFILGNSSAKNETNKSRVWDRLEGTGVTGHSLGGCVAYYLCRHFEEFICGINIDGGLFGDYRDTEPVGLGTEGVKYRCFSPGNR